MQAYLIKKPFEVSFSGNPMPFTFAVFPYGETEKSQDIRLIIKMLVEKDYSTGVFTEVRGQTFYPDADGMISLDIHTIIDPYLSYFLPSIRLAKPVMAQGQRKRYKITYQLTKDGENAGTLSESAMLHAIKGGMAYEHWHPAEFFTKIIGQQKQPLRYNIPYEKVFADEIKYLFWIYNGQPDILVLEDGNYVDDGSGNGILINEYTLPLRVMFNVLDNTGTVYPYTLPLSVISDKWSIGCAPVGFNQAGLQALVPAGNYAVSYTVEVLSESAQVVYPVTFLLEYRNFYRTYTLLYRNSLGSLETIVLRGQVDAMADYDRQQAQKSVPPDYFQKISVLPQVTDNVSEESAKFKGDTGFISRQAADKLRDLFLSPQKFELTDGKLLPIVINTKSTTFYTNRDSLISTGIEWQHAFNNRFFTPKMLMPSPAERACPAVENFQVTIISRDSYLIMYALQIPYEQIQVQIKLVLRLSLPGSAPAETSLGGGPLGNMVYTYVYEGNARSIVQQLNVPDFSLFSKLEITARTICDPDSNPASMGPATVITIPLIAKQPPVVADNTYTIDAGHTAYVTLPGSVLADDYDPDGNPVEAVPFTGGTAVGGFYIISADGTVSYLPKSAAFSGSDYFDYQVREVGSTETVTGRVNINIVALTAVVTNVYAKLVYRNVEDTVYVKSGTTKGEIWIDLFSDPAGTQPVNVTNLTVTAEIKVAERVFGNSYNKTTKIPYLANGTQVKIFDGVYSRYDNNGDTSKWSSYKRDTKLLAGTGYVVI